MNNIINPFAGVTRRLSAFPCICSNEDIDILMSDISMKDPDGNIDSS